MFYEDQDGELRTLSLSVARPGNEADPFLIKHVERMPYGSSWGSHGGSSYGTDSWQGHYSKRIGTFTLNCRIRELADEQRFRMSYTLGE